jgi:hypothetical protein
MDLKPITKSGQTAFGGRIQVIECRKRTQHPTNTAA